VLLVVYREDGFRRCNIGDVGISGWFLHAFVRASDSNSLPTE
jgi:hypothetical protein